jgi:hypothetical protein
VPAGFPPVWWYELDKANESVAMAKSAAFTRRQLVDRSDCWELWRCAAVDARAARIAWLTAFGGKATRTACAHRWIHDVNWSSRAALRLLAAQDQYAIARDFEAMVRELVSSHALLRDDAKTAKPDVRVVLRDERGDTRQPLPQPDDLLPPARKPPPRPTLQ